MARFILDVDVTKLDNTTTQSVMVDIMELFSSAIATIHCIDTTNNCQFHNNSSKNIITDEQIECYNSQINIISNE